MLIRGLILISVLFTPSTLLAVGPNLSIKTNLGEIIIQLDSEKAPITVSNFLRYVKSGSYEGTIFHRVIPGFMVQGGGHYRDLSQAPEGAQIYNEAANGLKNTRGTIAMARMNLIDSASRQFFINVSDNGFLDYQSGSSCTREQEKSQLAAQSRGLLKPGICKSYGYAVFGRVVDCLDVVDSIEVVKTGNQQGLFDVPIEPVVIEKISVLD